jgi:hypothetical protein
LPGGKSLSFVSPKESNQRKGDPDSPEFPKINQRLAALAALSIGYAKPSASGGRQRTRPAFDVFNWFFVGGAQTPLPLIHPPHLIFGGSVRGERSKPG